MIAGIGIDSVEIARFSEWKHYPIDKLYKIFTEQEVTYCLDLKNSQKAAERFAARFAVKEAFFKALSQILPNNNIPLLTVCKHIAVSRQNNGNPIIEINWRSLFDIYRKNTNSQYNPQSTFKSFVSITHTQHTATAIVLIEHAL